MSPSALMFSLSIATGGRAVIAIRGDTSLARDPTPGEKQRNRIVREIWKAGGRKAWIFISN